MLEQDKTIVENVELAELLAQRGFDKETLGTLLLIPLVHVAWADGRIDPDEEDSIVAVAAKMGLMTPKAEELLRTKLLNRPRPEDVNGDLELISLLLASVPDQLPVDVQDINDLAKAIGNAAGGVFGLAFTLSSEEKAALEQIREKLEVEYGAQWASTLQALRDDWNVDQWVEYEEPNYFDAIDLDNELLFTDFEATELYDAGLRSTAGQTLGVEDLKRTIFHDVMGRQPWGRRAAQLRLLMDEWIREGLISYSDRFWFEAPHGRVYDVHANIRYRAGDRVGRLRVGEQMVFAPRNRDAWPVVSGIFTARLGSVLCDDFTTIMVGAELEERPTRPMTEAAVEDLEIAQEKPVVYVLLDLSGSMAGERLERARDAIARFADAFPAEAGVSLVVRPFQSTPLDPLTPLGVPLGPRVRHQLERRLGDLVAGGTTALYQAVAAALDDVLRLVSKARVPRTWLIVLSDGEDNRGIEDVSYRGKIGEDALFARVRDFVTAGVLTYVPIAYGGRSAVLHLSRLAGPGTDVRVAYPTSIADRLQEVRADVLGAVPPPS